MKGKLLLIILLIITALSLVGFTVACDNPTTDKPLSFTLTEDGFARIEWARIDGAKNYQVYKSKTRYGSYAVETGKITNNYYVTDDVYAYYKISATDEKGAEITVLGPTGYDIETFGENTYIFSPTDPSTSINKVFADKYKTLELGEFSDMRFSAYFKSGTYSTTRFKVGYYTSVAGLGATPENVLVGEMTVDAPNSLINFWRTAENLTVNKDTLWMVSQATSLRKIKINGNLFLSSGEGKYTSGGFIADTLVTGSINSGSQQQWLTRDSKISGWAGGVYNMVFAGVDGPTPDDSNFATNPYTVLQTTDTLREKPYLTFTETDGYRVFVPDFHTNNNGVTWYGENKGEYIPISDFYVARSDRDTADTINTALESGKHLFLTAGVYNLDKPINVTRANTIVLGTGLATLKITDQNTDTLMRVSDVDGVIICGILFDTGTYSKSLLEVGTENSNFTPQTPTTLSDLFFRVGGAKKMDTKVDACVIINTNGVIGDNFWVWRADHHDGVGWYKEYTENVNHCKNGIIINGDNVTFYGLFVEHFLEYQTLWNGDNGKTYFYQSEIPYDAPVQSVWKSHDGTVNGYSSYKVSDTVNTHTAYGLGIYSHTLKHCLVVLDNAIEVPEKTGVKFNHVVLAWFGGNDVSGINYLFNGKGQGVRGQGQTSRVNGFENGVIS